MLMSYVFWFVGALIVIGILVRLLIASVTVIAYLIAMPTIIENFLRRGYRTALQAFRPEDRRDV